MPIAIPTDSQADIQMHTSTITGEVWATATIVGTDITASSQHYPHLETSPDRLMEEAFNALRALVTPEAESEPEVECSRGRRSGGGWWRRHRP